VVSVAGEVLGVATTIYNFFVDNWSTISPFVYGIAIAFGVYKTAMLVSAGVTKTITAVQWAMNAAMNANPIGLMIVAIGALIGVGILLYKNWDTIKTKAAALWQGIKGAFGSAVSWFQGIWSGVTGSFDVFMIGLSSKFPMLAQLIQIPIDTIKGVFEGLKQTFMGVVDFVAGIFTGNWSRAWEGVTGIFGGIFGSIGSIAKGPINAVIAIVNGAIRGINGINVTVPDWVPGIGGQAFGFAIPEIPALAKGGIATAPTLAMVGEGKESEAILPLSKLSGMLNAPIGAISALLQRFMDAVDGGLPSTGGGNISFSPQLVFNGPANKEDVQSAMSVAYVEFKKFMAQYERDKARTTLKPRR
jgi:hypothetical protein